MTSTTAPRSTSNRPRHFAMTLPSRLILFLTALTLVGIRSDLRGQAMPTVVTLHNFSALSVGTNVNADGAQPFAPLVQSRTDGNFYGTTYRGGSGGEGTVFSITPAGVFTNVYSFSALSNGVNADGAVPKDGVLQSSTDGNFYGQTISGGSGAAGTVFKVTPAGVLTTLYNFNPASTEGYFSYVPLVQSSTDGKFYGATEAGGSRDYGTIFSITPAGVLTTLYNFSAYDDVTDALVQSRTDGNFYGTTQFGGSHGGDTFFSVTPAGVFTILYSFGAVDSSGVIADGYIVSCSLVQGSDGNFYGATEAGGSNNAGTIFKITPAGVLTTLYSFSALSNGLNADGNVVGGLVEGSDGNFYGTTRGGGSGGEGTVFRITPKGVLTTLYSFSKVDGNEVNTDGALPYAALVQNSDGNFYGTTRFGGNGGEGTVFELVLNAPATPTPTPTPTPTATLTALVPTVSASSGEEGEFQLALSSAPSSDVVVNFAIKGTAVNGTDYVLLKASKKIKAGKTSKPIKIIPQGNLGGVSKKTVVLTLLPGDGYTVGTTGKVKVKITD